MSNTRPNENWEAREQIACGSKFKIDVNNPQMGADGSSVYIITAVTDNKEQHLCQLSESGKFRLHNDGPVEVKAGLNKKGKGSVDIILSTTEGDVCINANQNGRIRISGSNIELTSDVDIDLKANRNINLNAGARILLDGNKVDAEGLLGNVIEATVGSFLQRAFAGAGDKLGNDFLASVGGISKVGDISNIISNSPLGNVGEQLTSLAESVDTGAITGQLTSLAESVDTEAITGQFSQIAQTLPKSFSLPSGFSNSINLPI